MSHAATKHSPGCPLQAADAPLAGGAGKDEEEDERVSMADGPIRFTCPSGSVPGGRYLEVLIGSTSVLICRAGGRLSAVENRCSHMGQPLAGGRLIGNRLICPQHSAAFDVTTGRALSFPAVKSIRTFEVHEADGQITVIVEA